MPLPTTPAEIWIGEISKTHLPLPDQPVITAVAANLAAVSQPQRMPRGNAKIQPSFEYEAVTIQRAAIDAERRAADHERLAGRAADIAAIKDDFPALG